MQASGTMQGICPEVRDTAHNVNQTQMNGGGAMAKRFGRPSAQYRYEHYDPCGGAAPGTARTP